MTGAHGLVWRAAWALAPVTLTHQDIIRSLTPYSAAARSIGVPDAATATGAPQPSRVQGAGKSAGLICVVGALPLGTGWRVRVQSVYSVVVVTKARDLLKRQ